MSPPTQAEIANKILEYDLNGCTFGSLFVMRDLQDALEEMEEEALPRKPSIVELFRNPADKQPEPEDANSPLQSHDRIAIIKKHLALVNALEAIAHDSSPHPKLTPVQNSALENALSTLSSLAELCKEEAANLQDPSQRTKDAIALLIMGRLLDAGVSREARKKQIEKYEAKDKKEDMENSQKCLKRTESISGEITSLIRELAEARFVILTPADRSHP